MRDIGNSHNSNHRYFRFHSTLVTGIMNACLESWLPQNYTCGCILLGETLVKEDVYDYLKCILKSFDRCISASLTFHV